MNYRDMKLIMKLNGVGNEIRLGLNFGIDTHMASNPRQI